jgi:predicted 3-demethylubiquinone-9 3-methyltransferase (glyoxalase superfamily)
MVNLLPDDTCHVLEDISIHTRCHLNSKSHIILHHKHQEFDRLIRSVSSVTAALANVSWVVQ